ncbi:MAG TPA: cytosol nonspecific dipeptidase [Flavobacteriales bacterium]|nr:cytosol nonspecific dipeptidase [Flavobacteriales bacterium]
MSDIINLEPKAMWSHFAELNKVPRPSKKEDRVIAFIKQYGESLGLATTVDECGNVIIRKPASPGMENRKTVVLQSHLDMVHQKNADTMFDFDKEGIKMFVEGDWVKAKGTTLGADNGIGVASIMAILESKDIPHPKLEALFTIDEETGMTGAMGLKGGLLEAEIMLNLDTEDDDELTIGCAGGIDVSAEGTCNLVDVPQEHVAFSIKVRGLSGGHSGMDIHLGRANANKLLNRILYQLLNVQGLLLSSIDGGGLRNAIPREASAIITCTKDKNDEVKNILNKIEAELKTEFKKTDPNLNLLLSESKLPSNACDPTFSKSFIRAIYASLSGIYRMSPDIKGLVQTSNNLARIILKDGVFMIQCLTRSAVDTEKMDLANSLKSTFELVGAKVSFTGSYPGWTPRSEAKIITIMQDLYRSKFNTEAKVNACHAGLECGILGTNYPDMEMISFGPNIRGAHSPDEKVQISSVQKFWSLLLDTLEQFPNRN